MASPSNMNSIASSTPQRIATDEERNRSLLIQPQQRFPSSSRLTHYYNSYYPHYSYSTQTLLPNLLLYRHKRIYRPLLLLPLFIALVPRVLLFGLDALDALSHGWGAFSFAAALFFCHGCVYRRIAMYAPTREAYTRAMLQCTTYSRLMIATTLVMCCIARGVLDSLWSYSISTTTTTSGSILVPLREGVAYMSLSRIVRRILESVAQWALHMAIRMAGWSIVIGVSVMVWVAVVGVRGEENTGLHN